MSYNFILKNEDSKLNSSSNNNQQQSQQQQQQQQQSNEDDAINLIANKLTEQSLADLSKLYVAKLNNGSLKMTSMKKNESLLLNQKYYQIKQFEQDISGSGTDASNKIKQQLGQTSESLEGYAPDHPGFYVRYAVNGLSKTEPSGSGVPMNRNINRGDFGDDSGVICENSKCVIIGYLLIV